jgi:hypothetical protein
VSQVQTGTIATEVPARPDRLPWSRWHWMIERQSLEDIAQPLTAQDAGPTPAISREVRQ